MRMAVLAALVVAAMVGACRAEDEAGTIAGAGWVSCAEFAEHYQQNPKNTEDYFYSWAQGYISGLNAASMIRKNVRGWSIDKQKQHIRSHCAKNPLGNYVEAVQSVFVALPNR